MFKQKLVNFLRTFLVVFLIISPLLLSNFVQARVIGGGGPAYYLWQASAWGACSGGSGSWQYGSWSPATGGYCTSSLAQNRSASCTANASSGTATRSVWCEDVTTNTRAPSYDCAGSAPASSESCTPSSYSCGAEAATSQSVSDYSGCQYNWITSGWSAPNSSCSSSATETETVQCRRSDGTIVSNSDCNAASEPPSSQTVSDYSGCSYNWITSGWSAPNSSCSSSATETETVQCQRSDGTIVSNSDCNAASEPPSSQTVSDYSGCQYNWSSGNWSTCSGGSGTWQYSSWTPGTGSACTSSLSQTRTASCVANSGSGSQSRTETCLRSDGTAVSSSYCSGTAEPATSESCTPSSGFSCGTEGATSQTVPDYSTCNYSWQMSAWSAPSSTCSTTATETRTGTCLRSDGTTVPNSDCSGVTEPATSQTVTDLSTCKYTWEPGSWSACSGGSGTWSYTAWSPAAGTYCTASLNQTRTGTCNVTADSGSESRTVTCQRSDGTTVSGSYCTSAEPATSQACTPSSVDCGTEEPLTQTVSDYGGCTYSWQASGFGACVGGTGTWEYTAWSPTCGSGTFTQTRSASCVPNSNSATQTQTVTCLRSDGTTVAGSYCPTSSEPPASQACTPSSGYNCGTEAPLSQQVTMNTVCMAAMTACVPDPAKGIYCVTLPLK